MWEQVKVDTTRIALSDERGHENAHAPARVRAVASPVALVTGGLRAPRWPRPALRVVSRPCRPVVLASPAVTRDGVTP